MDETASGYVGRRHVIHIGGFDPVNADRLDHRLVSGLGKFAALWGLKAGATAPDISADGRIVSWQVEASGPNWATTTDYCVYRWDDLIAPYMNQVWWRTVIDGFAALAHFTVNGTLGRYFAANWRYGMFVVFPFLLLVAFAVLSVFAGRAVAGTDLPLATAIGTIVGAGLFIALLIWVGRYFQLYFALADWSFAADLAHDRVAGLEACLDRFAEDLAARVTKGGADEIILSGVSLGAVMMVEALARALARDAELCNRGPAVAFLTIGSSILKIGLHPAAAKLKSAVGWVSREAPLFWAEYQSKVDPINFYQTNPVEQMGLAPTGKPIVRTMRIRQTMTAKEYRYLKVNFLRLHRQFAMPNSRRYFYDFFMICFGPMSLKERVAAGEKAARAIDANGCYTPVPPATGRRRALMAAQ